MIKRKKPTVGHFLKKYNPLMRSKPFVLLFVPIFLTLTIFLGFLWWKSVSTPQSTNTQKVRFIIRKGSGAATIANNLEKKGLIKSAFSFKLYVQLKGQAGSIPPGEFEIPQNLSLPEVVSLLLDGPTELWVTIPEGLRREEIAEKFIETLDLSGSDKNIFRDEFLLASKNLEGYLFPDTYLFPRDTTAAKAVSVLNSTFKKKFSSLPNSTNLSPKETVILASILERETANDEERPIVAGILIKRYENDWPLQADATVQYILGKPGAWWPRPLSKDDLEINSAYNTYKFLGFPPAPISNPGISSLKAAVNYTKTQYWFYLHDTEGNIHYASSLEGHKKNIQKYLR